MNKTNIYSATHKKTHNNKEILTDENLSGEVGGATRVPGLTYYFGVLENANIIYY